MPSGSNSVASLQEKGLQSCPWETGHLPSLKGALQVPHRTRSYLQVHLGQADQHPCYKPLPEANRNEAHLKHPLDCVGCGVMHAVGVQARFGWKEVWQEVAERHQGNW